MRIRTGFVSNSSSTSFLIVTKGEMTLERFLALVGVLPGSVMGGVFAQLYEAMMDSPWHRVDFGADGAPEVDEAVASWRNADLSDHMMERIREAKGRGEIVIYGELSSDNEPVETFFCCESFELDGEGLYINALEATW